MWQGRAHVSPTKSPNSDLDPIGGDTEPTEAPRENVEMVNDDDEEPVEAEVPRARMNPKNSTSREKQEHEDSGHAGNVLFKENWCAVCVEGRAIGGQHRIELLDEERRRKSDFPCCFLSRFNDTRHCRHVSNSDRSRQQVWSNWSDMLRRACADEEVIPQTHMRVFTWPTVVERAVREVQRQLRDVHIADDSPLFS